MRLIGAVATCRTREVPLRPDRSELDLEVRQTGHADDLDAADNVDLIVMSGSSPLRSASPIQGSALGGGVRPLLA